MWMAGLPIGYTFYYGHLMMGILTKTLGLVPAVSYNLALVTLFALILSCAFGLAFALSGRISSGWIAGILCAVAGNPDGIKQYMDAIHQCFTSKSLSPLLGHTYDYWGPTRVIPFGNHEGSTINEFPYFSVLYGDMHAHTLAMPFAMLLIGLIASIYSSKVIKPFDWKLDWMKFLMAGFLLGGIVFLNTWEIPTWLVLIGIVFLIRNLSNLKRNILQISLSLTFGMITLALTLLGWWTYLISGSRVALKMDIEQHALGGSTLYLAVFGLLGFVAAGIFLFTKKTTRIFSKHLLTIALSIAGILSMAGFFWFPNFIHFHPQQNKIMWVLPDIRTSVVDYFSIYGFFLSVLLFSSVIGFSKEIINSIGKEQKTNRSAFIDGLFMFFNYFINPQNSVMGMISLGLASLAVIWGASWVHWTEPPDRIYLSISLATLAVVFMILALYFRKRLEFWMGAASSVLLWLAIFALNGIHLIRNSMPTLGLGLFSILWLLAFFHLGLAVRNFRDRSLSFSYILVAFFFFVTATLEIFVMSEYFGFGPGMRNNSMFKYGINAWTLASIGSGIFLPQILDFFEKLLKTVKREANFPRKVLLGISWLFLFVFSRMILDGFLSSTHSDIVYIFDTFFVVVALMWALWEKWLKNSMVKILAVCLAAFLALVSIVAILPAVGYGTLYNLIHQWCENQSAEILFPAILALVVLSFIFFSRERSKDVGRRTVYQIWSLFVATLIFAIMVYPLAATTRKAHGFIDIFRQQWVGTAEKLTLNGLEFVKRVNPADAAAIRFLNDHIPGQPCLVEFVGGRYEGWSSRYSIFTGIPALMGWDEVDEWVGARLGNDIQKRRSASHLIFQTNDSSLAKKYLDAYGVRLVIVGMAEKYGPHLNKNYPVKNYPTEGLAKFASFLPLIYKNPEVEIYYNPPSN